MQLIFGGFFVLLARALNRFLACSGTIYYIVKKRPLPPCENDPKIDIMAEMISIAEDGRACRKRIFPVNGMRGINERALAGSMEGSSAPVGRCLPTRELIPSRSSGRGGEVYKKKKTLSRVESFGKQNPALTRRFSWRGVGDHFYSKWTL